MERGDRPFPSSEFGGWRGGDTWKRLLLTMLLLKACGPIKTSMPGGETIRGRQPAERLLNPSESVRKQISLKDAYNALERRFRTLWEGISPSFRPRPDQLLSEVYINPSLFFERDYYGIVRTLFERLEKQDPGALEDLRMFFRNGGSILVVHYLGDTLVRVTLIGGDKEGRGVIRFGETVQEKEIDGLFPSDRSMISFYLVAPQSERGIVGQREILDGIEGARVRGDKNTTSVLITPVMQIFYEKEFRGNVSIYGDRRMLGQIVDENSPVGKYCYKGEGFFDGQCTVDLIGVPFDTPTLGDAVNRALGEAIRWYEQGGLRHDGFLK